MVGYFKKVNILFILLGAVLGFAAAWLMEKGIGAMVLFTVLGGGVGRFLCGIWANKQIDRWNELLFRKGEPEKFLEIFLPVMERTAKGCLEYVDGSNKLAYAWEALGDFDRAWDCLSALEPERLKARDMDGLITTYSNRVRLQLLMENVNGAEAGLEKLRTASQKAMAKNKRLGHAGMHYAKLYENWLLILRGEEADVQFIEEEIKLSNNRIRSSELQLVLAKAYTDDGDDVMAEELLLDAMSTGVGLWAERKARELLRGK